MFVKKTKNTHNTTQKQKKPQTSWGCGIYQPYLLLLRFPSFYTNPSDLQYRFWRLSVPGPESLLNVLPDGVPRFRFSFPAQTDLQQVANILFSKHQEGVGQVQTYRVLMAGQREEKKTLSQVVRKVLAAVCQSIILKLIFKRVVCD